MKIQEIIKSFMCIWNFLKKLVSYRWKKRIDMISKSTAIGN